jgi:hypothetical protein
MKRKAIFAGVTLVVLLAGASPGWAKKPCTSGDIELLAKAVWGEARGCDPAEQSLVIWTVLQRVDAGDYGDTIEAVLTDPRQFGGYRAKNPVDPEIYALCAREASKWASGDLPPTSIPYAPTRPYLFFDGRRGNDGKRHNYFRKDWRQKQFIRLR